MGHRDEPADRAMLLTPQGAGAIAVIRIAGPHVTRFLKDRFDGRASAGMPVHGNLSSEAEIIDDPVVVLGPGGRFADINLHGGTWIVQAVLELLRRDGFVVVNADVDELDSPLERDVLAALPRAKTELALRSLLSQVKLFDRNRVDPRDRSLFWLLHPPRIAIVGPANVGKSTLANQLFAQERSITADVPGTTRDWVGETANLKGLAVELIDTPGMRETLDPIESTAIEQSAEQIRLAEQVVLVLDASRPLMPEQSPLLDQFESATLVANKVDLQPRWDFKARGAIEMIATRGTGVDELVEKLLARFDSPHMKENVARYWTREQFTSAKCPERSPE